MRLGGTKLGTISTGRGLGNPLWDVAGSVPSLDLQFADTKSLTDARTGQNLITFSRASSGTYVDVDGTLQTANNDVARFDHAITATVTNLLLQSNQFDTTWVNVNSVESRIADTAPDGTNTAWEVRDTVDAVSTTHSVQQTTSFTAGVQYTFSCWLKAGTQDRAILLYPAAQFGGTAKSATLEFATGNVTTANTPDSAVATQFPNGWWRLAITATATSTGSGALSIRIGQFGGSNYQGNGTGTILIWGAQLEQSSTAGTYVPTSTTSVTKNFTESLGLLVEEARTNSIRNNTMVGAVAGTPGTAPTNWTITSSATGLTREIVGTGTESGITYIDIKYSGTSTSAGSLQFSADTTTGVPALTGQTWTGSSYVRLVGGSLPGAAAWVWLERDSGGTIVVSGSGGSVSVTQDALNSQRRTTTRTLSGGATVANLSLRIDVTIPNTTAVDVTLRIGLPQLEQGAFATSVIPTTGTAATRSADVASITGTNFSSWYNQSEGTLYAEAQIGRQNALAGAAICGIETGVQNAEALYLHYRGTGLTAAQIFDSSVLQMDQSPYGTAVAASTTTKHAFAVKLNDSVSAGGGTALTTDTVCTMPTPDRMLVGFSTVSSNYLSGVIRRLTYWPARLANPTLQDITR